MMLIDFGLGFAWLITQSKQGGKEVLSPWCPETWQIYTIRNPFKKTSTNQTLEGIHLSPILNPNFQFVQLHPHLPQNGGLKSACQGICGTIHPLSFQELRTPWAHPTGTTVPLPDAPCMEYLPTFGWDLW